LVVTWNYNAGTNTATASGAGSTNFAALVAADTAGGWGKFTADATGTQILCKAKIVLGGGGSSFTFSDLSKQVYFITGLIAWGGDSLIYQGTGANVTFGELVDASNHATDKGIDFIDGSVDGSYHYLLNNAAGTTKLYSVSVTAIDTAGACYIGLGNNAVQYNCLYRKNVDVAIKGSVDSYNIVLQNPAASGTNIELYSSAGTFNRINIQYGNIGLYTYSTYGFTIKNLLMRGTTYVINPQNWSGTGYIINGDIDNWVFYWSNTTGKVYRQYEFDLQVCDNAASELAGTVVPIEGAEVTLYDQYGTEVFNETSDAAGWIPTQTVSRGYYNQANGNTLQDYGPHFLVVTKAGYEDYMDECIIVEKRTNQISMNVPSVPADLATATPPDVLSGETFFGKAGSMETGTYQIPALTGPRTIIKRVENPTDEALLMATGVLLIRKRKLTKQNKQLQLENLSLRRNKHA
jgi:hypothetical protein